MINARAIITYNAITQFLPYGTLFFLTKCEILCLFPQYQYHSSSKLTLLSIVKSFHQNNKILSN